MSKLHYGGFHMITSPCGQSGIHVYLTNNVDEVTCKNCRKSWVYRDAVYLSRLDSETKSAEILRNAPDSFLAKYVTGFEDK